MSGSRSCVSCRVSNSACTYIHRSSRRPGSLDIRCLRGEQSRDQNRRVSTCAAFMARKRRRTKVHDLQGGTWMGQSTQSSIGRGRRFRGWQRFGDPGASECPDLRGSCRWRSCRRQCPACITRGGMRSKPIRLARGGGGGEDECAYPSPERDGVPLPGEYDLGQLLCSYKQSDRLCVPF